MSTCATLSGNILFDCDYPMVAGVNDNLLLLNKETWDNAVVTRNGVNPQIVEGIVLPTGEVAYKIEGKNNSVEPTQKLVKQKYSEVFDHEITFKAFKSDAATKKQLENLARGRVVAIVLNNHKGNAGAGAYELYGNDAGLEVQELERLLNDADTQGAYNIILRTPEVSKEAHLPATIFLTSFAATKAIVDGLLA